MAVTNIDLSDPISTLVTKTNTISADLGDKATLGTTATSSLVAAINEINAKVVGIDTEAEIAAQVETYFNTQGHVLDVRGFHADSANVDSATFTNITVNGETQLDSARFTNFALKSNSGASAGATIGNLSFAKPLQIKNSSGTVLLAGYIVSTDSDNGTI
jgi:hypothetical protein